MNSKFRNALFRTTAAVAMAGLIASAGAAAQPKATVYAAEANILSGASASQSYDIVVLGDSLAAGYEFGFTESSIPYGFAEHIYEQALFRGLRANYTNYAVLGLRSESLSKWLTDALADKQVTGAQLQPGLPDPRAEQIFAKSAQLVQDLRAAELVAISIGGNDFLSLVRNMASEENSFAAYDQLPAAERNALDAELKGLLDNYESQLSATLTAVQSTSPEAQVVVSNQYLPIPFIRVGGGRTYLIDASTASFLADGQTELLKRLESVVDSFVDKGMRIAIADAATPIESNLDRFTTVRDSSKNNDIHPTRFGYAELGKAYSSAIWGDYISLKAPQPIESISIVVGGEELFSQYKPTKRSNRTFLAITDVTDALGAEWKWDAKTNTVTIMLEDRTVDITIGADTVRVNGNTLPLDAPAYLQWIEEEKTSKTYVPLRALSDGLGFQVEYRGTLNAAFINR